MDILDLVITILIIGGSLFLSSRKKKKEKTVYDETPEYHEYDEDMTWEEPVTQNTPSPAGHLEDLLRNTSKSHHFPSPQFGREYSPIADISQNEIKRNQIQNTENEEESDFEFTFSHDEIKKGIIYSEILKRPNF